MNGRIVTLDVPAHQAVRELLPWYAAAQLAPDQMRQVDEHLRDCPQCRQDLAWEHGMRAEAAACAGAMPAGVDMEGALARLLPALDAQQRQEPAPTPAGLPWWRRPAANQPSWLRWAVAAQSALIVGLLALLARPAPEPAGYRVLGAAVAPGGDLVVVFRPDTSERELRRILQAQHARVVDGPTVTDAYLLKVPAASRDRALRALRAEPAVQLAEPLDRSAAP